MGDHFAVHAYLVLRTDPGGGIRYVLTKVLVTICKSWVDVVQMRKPEARVVR